MLNPSSGFSPTIFLFSIDESVLAHYSQILTGQTDVSHGLSLLAKALCSAPWWDEFGSAQIVIHPNGFLGDGIPALVLIGEFDAGQQVRIVSLRQRLLHFIRNGRYVAYPQIESDCAILSDALIDQLGVDGVQNAYFVGIPRGGLIVLGILSYALALHHKQLEPLDDFGTLIDSTKTLIVVDDCAMSGNRFSRFLTQLPDGVSVVFAPLYAHPDLLAAIEAEEDDVVACVCGHHLQDFAAEQHGGDVEQWRLSWLERTDQKRYWVGVPENLCFPWSEPDVSLWNPIRQQSELSWPMIPPEMCLKTRSMEGTIGERWHSITDFQQPSGLALGVFCFEWGDTTILANFEQKRALLLQDVHQTGWRLIVERGISELLQEHPLAISQACECNSKHTENGWQPLLMRLIDDEYIEIEDGASRERGGRNRRTADDESELVKLSAIRLDNL